MRVTGDGRGGGEGREEGEKMYNVIKITIKTKSAKYLPHWSI